VPERIFEMCRAVGLHDIAAKMPRSKNPMNSVKATYDALMNQPDPEEIAVGRGKKLVDARKVYYGGAVL
jgi:small subunit ribosomal protein S5